MSNKEDHPFDVWINPDCLEKFNMYATEAILQRSSEIGGFARVQEEDNTVFVTDVFIPEQRATAGTFDISPEMDSEFMRYMMKQGKREDIKNWKSIVHSHPVGMGPSMSGTDVTAIQRRAEDGECYSLIMSASRDYSSTRLFMHYCLRVGGKYVIFRDIPVNVGWNMSRRDRADELAELVGKELVGEDITKEDASEIRDAMREAMCTYLPPRFESERKKLLSEIKKEVAQKIPAPQPRSWDKPSTYNQWKVNNKHKPKQMELVTNKTAEIRPGIKDDLQRSWLTIQRLYCIAYDHVDPENRDPNHYVSKEEAKKARRLHKKTICEFNNKLRTLDGFGMGDLVTISPEALDQCLMEDPVGPWEIEDFDINGGLVSYEVDSAMFWATELELVTPYESIMGWDEAEVKA